MKKIGVILRKNKSYYNKDIYSVNYDLDIFLNRFNVLVIYYVLNPSFKINKIFIDSVDGVILPGGDNINNDIYPVIKYLYDIDKPVLGICQGMQELGLTFNGKITKLNTSSHYKNDNYVHEICLDKNSMLYKILNTNVIMVNSRHKEILTNTNLNRVGYSKDFLIEAIEEPKKKFFIGIQWHPESLYFDKYSIKLFNYFINML